MGFEGEGDLERALRCLPTGCFVMTAAHEGKRSGMRIRSVQACADEPLLIAVAARKGHAIDPLIRDSRSFAVCVIAPDDRLTMRSFPMETANGATGGIQSPEGDPFDGLEHAKFVTGAPVLARALAVFDCEIARRIDLEADHELFVGHVVGVRCAPEKGASAPGA